MRWPFVYLRKIFLLVFVITALLLHLYVALCDKVNNNNNSVGLEQRKSSVLRGHYLRSSSTSSSGSLVFVGVLVAVGGQFLIASGAVLQKYTHEKIRKRVQEARRLNNRDLEATYVDSAGLSVEVGNQNTEPKRPLKEDSPPVETSNGDKQDEEQHKWQLDQNFKLFETRANGFGQHRNSVQQRRRNSRAASFDDWDKAKRREEMLHTTGEDWNPADSSEMSVDVAALSRLRGLASDDLDRYSESGNYVSTQEENDTKSADMVSRLRKVRRRLHTASTVINRPRSISVTSEPVRKKTLFNMSPPQSPHLNWEDVATRHGLQLPNSESFRQIERAIEEQHREDAGTVERTHYLKRKGWWFGLLLIGGGEVCNLVAFGFAPGSTIAPLGVLVVPINALLAWKFLKEKITWITIAGILLSVAGAVLVGVFGPTGADSTGALNQSQILHLLDNVAFIVFISITVGVICAIFVINMITGVGVRFLLVYALMSGMSAAVSVTSAKGVVQLIRYSVTGKGDQFAKPLIYVMTFVLVVTIVFMVYYMNRGMQTFRVTLFLAVYYGFFMTFSVVSSILMYQEYHYITAYNTPFFIGIGLIFIGISVISLSSRPQEAEEEEAEFVEALRRYWASHGRSSSSHRGEEESRQESSREMSQPPTAIGE